MVFNSLQFMVFFSIVVAGYFLLPGKLRWIWLLAASFFFYGVAEPVFLLQILAATAVSFGLAIRIESEAEKQRKKHLLTAGVLLLIANLGVFKYATFLNETFRALFGFAEVSYPVPAFQLILPIGISFYTFQLISYLVDVARGAKAERHFGIFTLYVTLFPKVIAGPIERGKNLLPQLHAIHAFEYARVVFGLQLMAWGVFKKVVVADRIAPFVNKVYDNPHAFDGVVTSIVTWLYAFQLYCDFSGYTDIALGAAAILGFKLMNNFNRPYFATSIQDFWKRWHISLTSWLTDYVYTPMTRTKLLKIKWYTLMLVSLFVTFVVSGLWHGAQWTFVAWGALHGFYMVAATQLQKPWNKIARSWGLNDRPELYRGLKIAVTFTFVCLAYVLFRAHSLTDAAFIYGNLPTGWSRAPHSVMAFFWGKFPELALALAGIAIVMGAELLQGRVKFTELLAERPKTRWALYYAGTVSIILLGAFYDANQKFIYFRF